MNKAKFAKKCAEIPAYESEILSAAKDYLKDKVKVLEPLGLCTDICLLWINYVKNAEPSLSRIPYEDGYMCELFFQIRKSDDPFPDWDLTGIWTFVYITRIENYGFFWGNIIGKKSIKQVNKWLKYVDRLIAEVLSQGYEYVLNKK